MEESVDGLLMADVNEPVEPRRKAHKLVGRIAVRGIRDDGDGNRLVDFRHGHVVFAACISPSPSLLLILETIVGPIGL